MIGVANNGGRHAGRRGSWRGASGRGGPQLGRGGRPVEPTEPIQLTYGSSTNVVKWIELMGRKITTEFGINGSWWHTGAYPEFPFLVEEVDYTLEDIDPATDIGGVRLARVKKENDLALSKKDRLATERVKQFALMWANIRPESREVVSQRASQLLQVEQLEGRDDPLALKTWVTSSHMVTTTGNLLWDRDRASSSYQNLRQSSHETLSEYKERFLRAVATMAQFGGAQPPQPELVVRFLNSLDSRYSACVTTLFNLDRAVVNPMPLPATLVAAFNAVAQFQVPRNGTTPGIQTAAVFSNQQQGRGGRGEGQRGRGGGRSGGRDGSGRGRSHGGALAATAPTAAGSAPSGSCFTCGSPEHWARDCPDRERARNLLAQSGTAATSQNLSVTAQQSGAAPSLSFGVFVMTAVYLTGEMPPPSPPAEPLGEQGYVRANHARYAVILDTGAQISVFRDAELLTDIRAAPRAISMTGITGNAVIVNTVGTFGHFGEVYLYPEASANTLSFASVSRMCQVTLVANGFDVSPYGGPHDGPAGDVTFACEAGHYVAYFAAANEPSVLLTTVEDRESLYTKREVTAAQRARVLQGVLGFPSQQDFLRLLQQGAIKGVDVTHRDALRAMDIYGPSVAELKGKTRAQQAKPVSPEYVPRPIRSQIQLHADLFFVEGEGYLLTVSAPLGMLMMNFLGASRSASTLLQAVKSQLNTYRLENFVVDMILVDGEGGLKKIKDDVEAFGVRVNQTGAGEHVPKAEVYIKVVKERVRSVLFSLPYNLPAMLMKWLVSFCVARINYVPSSQSLVGVSPIEAFRGRKLDFARDTPLAFGAYCQIAKPNLGYARSSVTVARTEGGLALISMSNLQKSVKFFSLESLSYITRHQYKQMPIPAEVIAQINALAAKGKAVSKTPSFERLDKSSIAGAELDEEPFVAAGRIFPPGEPVKLMGDGRGDEIVSDPTASEGLEPVEFASGDADGEDGETDPMPMSDAQAAESLAALYESSGEQHDAAASGHVDEDGAMDSEDRALLVANISVKRAMTMHPAEAKASIEKELRQMVTKGVFEPVQPQSLSQAQRRSAIPSFMFLKKKVDPNGNFTELKSRFVAGGHKQDRDLYDETELSSPTVSLSSLLIAAGIAAKERRIVVTIDIAGAYLNATMLHQDVYMRVDAQTAETLSKIEPSYSAFRDSNGALFVKLRKALYGCVESAKLWFEHLTGTLRSLGYEPNPMDRCVWNKVEDGVQCTVLVYVDDLKVSCTALTLIEALKKRLVEVYKTVKVHEGKVLPYLAMLFDYTVDGEVKVTMQGYIEDCIGMARELGRASTPATLYLFDVDPESPLLNVEDKTYFHSVVAKVYYLAKRVRPDVLTALSFLTTRTSAPTLQDYGKIARVLDYLSGTRSLGIVLRPSEGPLRLHNHIDASHGNHPDMKSHQGVVIGLGEGPVFVRSTKQGLVTRSSAESELVALSDGVTYVIWSREFLIHQGYAMGPAIVYQDNQATIAMAKRGPSASGNSRHINIRYYFVTGRVEAGEIALEYLPTENMVSDMLTKPLQGSEFRRQRAVLLNWRYG